MVPEAAPLEAAARHAWGDLALLVTVALALTEHHVEALAAVAAFASGWWIIRLGAGQSSTIDSG
ncbi:hypothetical protein [Nocardioides taihuensis]|uniref:Cation transporter n=1 Tax=Nocardioides taihuensis TaxID=1835606 RepID=A0ABW0BF14_9ACTN